MTAREQREIPTPSKGNLVRHLNLYRWAETLVQDVHHGVRTLRKSPSFTIVAIAMLALGIGINAAVFTVVDAALFKGFALVRANDRIVQITTTKGFIYYPDFQDWRANATSFEAIALVRGVFHTLSDGDGPPETYFTTEVTANAFGLLGVAPMLGRDFSPADEQRGAEPVVILRYETWVSRFGGNPTIVGKVVRIDGMPTRVIGVMPQRFSFPTSQDLWTPLVPTPGALRRETGYAQYAYARMTDGATVEGARAEMDAIGRQLASAYPGSNEGVAPVVRGFEEWFVGPEAATLYKALWGAVVFLLLIVCANVATLAIERATSRAHEIALRLALGAGRWRIVRESLAESLIVSILGGVTGWWIAKVGVRMYALAQMNGGATRVLGLTTDDRALAYLVAISLGTGLVVGVATALHLTRADVNNASKDVSRGIAGGRYRRPLSALFVGSEIALAVVLLTSAGVFVRSFFNVYAADVGVNTANVLTMSLYVPPERYTSTEGRISFYRELRSRLQAVPGVESVAFGTAAPTDAVPRVAYELADTPTVEKRSTVAEPVVSTTYFQTLGVRVIAGRTFDDLDRGSSIPIVIVNQAFASRHWPSEDPLGKRLRLFGSESESSPWLTVVGVVSNVVQNDRTRQAFDPLVYVPYEQHAQPNMFAFVRTNVAPANLAAAVRREIYAMDPMLPVPALWPLSERFDRAYGFERNVASLLLFFAGVALLLASVGVYTTISCATTRRVREIGVRLAIGATGRDILKLVFRQETLPVVAGLIIGLAVSLAVTRLLRSQLIGVSPADPITLAGASSVLGLCAALGCWMPARRAMRVDPVVALKRE